MPSNWPKLIFMRIKSLLLGLAVVSFIPFGVQAQGIKNAQANLKPIVSSAGLSDQGSLEGVVGTIVNAALSLVGLIFLVLMVYAGFTWMLAQGDEGKIDKSKEIIKACIIGLIITASAYAITFFVTNRFESASNGAPTGGSAAGPFCLSILDNGATVACLTEAQMTDSNGVVQQCTSMWYTDLPSCEKAMNAAGGN